MALSKCYEPPYVYTCIPTVNNANKIEQQCIHTPHPHISQVTLESQSNKKASRITENCTTIDILLLQ